MNSAQFGPLGRIASISKNTHASPAASSPFFTTTSQPITRAFTILSAPAMGAIDSTRWIDASFLSTASSSRRSSESERATPERAERRDGRLTAS
jgi:hypothetical protein